MDQTATEILKTIQLYLQEEKIIVPPPRYHPWTNQDQITILTPTHNISLSYHDDTIRIRITEKQLGINPTFHNSYIPISDPELYSKITKLLEPHDHDRREQSLKWY